MTEPRTVLLIESDPGIREGLGAALEAEGHEVISCPGPTAPDYTCIGGRDGYCPLVERADVVVLDPWLAGEVHGIGTTAQALIDVYVRSGRTVLLLGSATWVEPFAEGHLVCLGDRPRPDEVVMAVRMAPEASGFVLRSR